jgi:hypothetical protein
MLRYDDEFDLDVRISDTTQWQPAVAGERPALAGDMEQVESQETCGIECVNDTTVCETAGCNTSETCDQVLCSDAITLPGRYCEDQSDDTCHACPGPETGGCGDPPD